jgi:hypothetical protein
VKVLPKIKSLAGRGSVGVVVLVIDSLEGSMSGRVAADIELLYCLDDSHTVAVSLAGDCLRVPRRHNWRSILVASLDETVGCQRRGSRREHQLWRYSK